jgi:hypothetical protein
LGRKNGIIAVETAAQMMIVLGISDLILRAYQIIQTSVNMKVSPTPMIMAG